MTIGSISSNAIYGITSVASQTTATSTVGSSDATTGVTVQMSKPAQLFSQLSDLASSDPDKFKQVTTDIAQKLKDAAGSQDGKRADFLNQLADKFSAASQSGSATDLAPQRAQGHHGGHHHHHGQGGGGGGAPSGGGQPASNSGGGDLFQTVQSIISGALSGASG